MESRILYCGTENEREVKTEHFLFDLIVEFGLEQIGWFHLAFSTFKFTASNSSSDFLISTTSGPPKMIANGTEQSVQQNAFDYSEHFNVTRKKSHPDTHAIRKSEFL